jgi:hypothetical protein
VETAVNKKNIVCGLMMIHFLMITSKIQSMEVRQRKIAQPVPFFENRNNAFAKEQALRTHDLKKNYESEVAESVEKCLCTTVACAGFGALFWRYLNQ